MLEQSIITVNTNTRLENLLAQEIHSTINQMQ